MKTNEAVDVKPDNNRHSYKFMYIVYRLVLSYVNIVNFSKTYSGSSYCTFFHQILSAVRSH